MNLGVHGGNLENAVLRPEARRAHFNAPIDPASGLPGLHKPDEFKDTATIGRKIELPWHRMAAFMLLNRRTNSEIAMAAGVDVTNISQLRSQRWFQELLATLANRDGEEISCVIKAEALASVEKLVELRDKSESERIQLAAATTLLEHAEGKPTQKVISLSATTTFSSEKEELESIQAELSALRNANPAAVIQT